MTSPHPEATGVRATLRTPGFGALWTSNLVHFSAWFAQLVVLQWLVTSLTDSRTLLGVVGFAQGATMFLLSPAAEIEGRTTEETLMAIIEQTAAPR